MSLQDTRIWSWTTLDSTVFPLACIARYNRHYIASESYLVCC